MKVVVGWVPIFILSMLSMFIESENNPDVSFGEGIFWVDSFYSIYTIQYSVICSNQTHLLRRQLNKFRPNFELISNIFSNARIAEINSNGPQERLIVLKSVKSRLSIKFRYIFTAVSRQLGGGRVTHICGVVSSWRSGTAW